MIRKLELKDLDRVMEIWLYANITAHNFIDENYWRKNYEVVTHILPESNVYVYEQNGDIEGFVGLADNYIAGIFVDTEKQSNGIGKMLLDFIKSTNTTLTLSVYKNNLRAVKFYQREDFVISKEQPDDNTGETEFFMTWIKEN